jgi:predicted enzyme related to lactoylglutathione lyase
MGPMGTYQVFSTSTAGGGMMTLPPFLAEKGGKLAWLFYFTVEDIKAVAQRITDGGGTITHGPAPVPGGAWIVQAIDPQGGAFGVTAAQ